MPRPRLGARADLVERILDAGGLAGSVRDRQPCRFVVVQGSDNLVALAEAVFEPKNVTSAGLIVAIVTAGGKGALDVGRTAQNMMLTPWAWECSRPRTKSPTSSGQLPRSGADEDEPAIVIFFVNPQSARNPATRTAEEWSQRADRRPLDEIVERR